MEIHTFEQYSPDWFAIRKGRMTASHAQEIGNSGKGLDTYIHSIVADMLAPNSADMPSYSNAAMEAGLENEKYAVTSYEMQQGVTVNPVGFVSFTEFAGCSPDGLVGEDGGIEVKCHNTIKHMRLFLYGPKEIESKYIWQIQMNLLITGRKWWDFISYNPYYLEPLFVHRITPDLEKFKALTDGIDKGSDLLLELLKKLDQIHGAKN